MGNGNSFRALFWGDSPLIGGKISNCVIVLSAVKGHARGNSTGEHHCPGSEAARTKVHVEVKEVITMKRYMKPLLFKFGSPADQCGVCGINV